MVRSEELRIRTIVVVLLAALLVAMLILVGPGSSSARADATFTVNSTGDENDLDFPAGVFDGTSDGKCDVSSGVAGDQCTLRAAIQEANLTGAPDTIRFGIPASLCNASTTVCTISPTSILPDITQQVSINGYTQAGSSVNTKALGTNAKLTIELNGTNAGSGSSGLGIFNAQNSLIRGLVINRFAIDGIDITGANATGNRVEGNFLGTDPTGTLDRGNGNEGVFIKDSNSSVIGGTTPDKRNLISGNTLEGISMIPSSANRVEGNLIGTQRDGLTALGNGTWGVDSVASSNNTIGGATPASANTIAFNGEDGVEPSGGTGNRILSNSIFSNEGLGIDLFGNDGVTPNDLGDGDSGANLLQNFPEITSAKTSRRATTIVGTLNSTPNTTFTLQFFSSPQPDPSGFGEGQTFKVQKSVSTDNGGDGTFSFKLKRGKKIAVGQFVTATATDPQGNTSEFSAAVEVVRP